jgi:NAD(P)-dependent dehydrogenase (short-subunit alcohol dehydrogenase family)
MPRAAPAARRWISEPEHFHAALARIDERFGGLDVLVNNAALTLTTPIMEISVEEFDRVTSTNLRGTFLGCQIVGRYFSQPDRATLSISPRWRDKMAPPPAPIMRPRKAAS